METLVRLDSLLFGAHDMSWEHVNRYLGIPRQYRKAIEVERLPFGYYYVQDGRHRATAAYEEGRFWILARLVTH